MIKTKREEFYQSHKTSEESFNIYQEILNRGDIRKDIEKIVGEMVNNKEKLNYLDIGCGTGKRTLSFKHFLEDFDLKVIANGLDISQNNVSEAVKSGINAVWHDIEKEKPPFQADIITCFEVIEHIYDTDRFVRNVYDTLNTSGVLIVSTPNTISWKNRISMIFGIPPLNLEVSLKDYYGLKLLKRFFKNFVPSAHIRGFTPLSLKELLEDNGFKVISTWGLENWRIAKFFGSFPSLATNFLLIARRKDNEH